MKILNLYAGIGGNRKLWQNAEVTAVEQDPKIATVYAANFPQDTLIIGDAHEYLLEHYADFDFIWSSPPCQTHSRMMKATRHKNKKYPDMTLWQEIIFLQNFCKKKFVVENVQPYYKPLIEPTQVIGRHYFWANFFFLASDVKNPRNFIGNGTLHHARELKEWLGFDFAENIYYAQNHDPCQVLRNCVHPEIGQNIMTAARAADYGENIQA
jgi:DNA (cytosine-5)-methyltransferase 1